LAGPRARFFDPHDRRVALSPRHTGFRRAGATDESVSRRRAAERSDCRKPLRASSNFSTPPSAGCARVSPGSWPRATEPFPNSQFAPALRGFHPFAGEVASGATAVAVAAGEGASGTTAVARMAGEVTAVATAVADVAGEVASVATAVARAVGEVGRVGGKVANVKGAVAQPCRSPVRDRPRL
jgi:hypothetical protein